MHVGRDECRRPPGAAQWWVVAGSDGRRASGSTTLRREVGFSAGEILFTTVASFAGGLASLYLWGRVVVYHGFFAVAAGLRTLAFLPLREFGR